MERVDGSLKTKARTAWTKDEREEEECRREFNMHGGIFERFCALNSDVCSPINVVVDVVIIIIFCCNLGVPDHCCVRCFVVLFRGESFQSI